MNRRWFLSLLANLCFWRPKPVPAMPGPHYGPCSLKMLADRYGDRINITGTKFNRDGDDCRCYLKINGEWEMVTLEAWNAFYELRVNSGLPFTLEVSQCLRKSSSIRM